jgi:Rad3-related DNA helicase
MTPLVIFLEIFFRRLALRLTRMMWLCQTPFNEEQRAAYDDIMSSVDTKDGGLFFVDGPGGTEKTYLYRALLATIRSQKKIVVATATSGVATSIMPGGRTAHSRFKIPLTIDDGAFCTFMKQSGTAKLLRASSLIIWDEASMTKRQSVEVLDNSLRDIMDGPELPFRGKTEISDRFFPLFGEGQGLRWSVPRYVCHTFGIPCDI